MVALSEPSFFVLIIFSPLDEAISTPRIEAEFMIAALNGAAVVCRGC